MTDLPYPPPYMDVATLAAHLCVSESTIDNWVRVGAFPPPRRIGGKRLWSWKEVCRLLDGEQEKPSQVSLLERITNATREAARQSEKNHE